MNTNIEAHMAELEIDRNKFGRECYEEEVQPYQYIDYKPIIYIYSSYLLSSNVLLSKFYLKNSLKNCSVT